MSRASGRPYAAAVLITAFGISSTPTKEQREKLAEAIGTTERRVQVWFQNRRQRATGSSNPTGESEPRPEAADMSDGSDEETDAQVDEPYPVSVLANVEEESHSETVASSAAVERVLAAVPSLKEGCVKTDLRMEAFTTLFPPFEVRARLRLRRRPPNLTR